MIKTKKLAKLSMLVSALTLSPSVVAESIFSSFDYGLSVSRAFTDQELNFVNPQNGDSSSVTLFTATDGLQFFISSENWSFSTAIQDTSSTEKNETDVLAQSAGLEQSGHEFSLGYYQGDWSYHLTFGESDYDVTQNTYQARPSLAQDIVSSQTSNRTNYQDTFWQVSASKWIDLTNLNENLAATLEVSAGYFDSSGRITRQTQIQQNQHGAVADRYIQVIEERNGKSIQFGQLPSPQIDTSSGQWLYTISGSLDYAQTWWQKDWFISTWFSLETSDSDEGSLTLSRPGRGPNNVGRSIRLDQEVENEEDLIQSGGLDITINLTSNWSASLGVSDSNIAQPQYQMSAYLSF